jgi:hypothetical protein
MPTETDFAADLSDHIVVFPERDVMEKSGAKEWIGHRLQRQ